MQKNVREELVQKISPHTEKKFEIIEAYVNAWAMKLLEHGLSSGNCKGILFIDCMSNSGLYASRKDGSEIVGTPVRVAKALRKIMGNPRYRSLQAWLYFNDLSQEKIDILKNLLPEDTDNFHCRTSVGDANALLQSMGQKLPMLKSYPYLMLYDPYQASIDWKAIHPFLNNWGEVIINHMISDSIRAVGSVTRIETMEKYELTYHLPFGGIQSFGSDKAAFEKRVEQIIWESRNEQNRPYFISAVPFFNSCNALVYNLIHCTSNRIGFKLFKSTAWKAFGNQSSAKREKDRSGQVSFNMIYLPYDDEDSNIPEDCYHIYDIAKYIQKHFRGRQNVPCQEVWDFVDDHPVFPTDGFKRDIEKELKELFNVTVSGKPKCMSFKDE